MKPYVRSVLALSLCFAILQAENPGEDSLDLFSGLELQQQDNFLEQSYADLERRAEELTVEFNDDEARILMNVVSEVDGLLETEDPRAFLESDLQSKLLIIERDWAQREGARLVVKLLEAVRIKAVNYVQNALLLERLEPGTAEYEETEARTQRFRDGIVLSNRSLEGAVHEASRL